MLDEGGGHPRHSAGCCCSAAVEYRTRANRVASGCGSVGGGSPMAAIWCRVIR